MLTVVPAVLTALAVAGPLESGPVVVVALLQVGFLVGWFRLGALPGAAGGTVLGLVVAATADLALLSLQNSAAGPPAGRVAGILGIGFLAVIVVQLLRGRGRLRPAAALAAGVTAMAVTATGALWLSASTVAAPVVAVGLVAGSTVGSLRSRPPVRRAVDPLAAALAVTSAAIAGAGVIGWPASGRDATAGAVVGAALGAVAGAVAATTTALTDAAGADPATPPTARVLVAGTLPVLLGGPVAALLGPAVLG
jgi:hypothetical protein